MKRISIILAFILALSLPGYAQWEDDFDWDDPDCSYCLWMENAIGMSDRQAYDYQYIIHQYGIRIEREANRSYRYWDRVAKNIYELRMERDSRLQDILSPSQFRLYITLSREQPTRIHDWNGWFNTRRYVQYYPSSICYRYEDHYWHSLWEFVSNRWYARFDDGGWYFGKYKYPEFRPNPRYDNNRRYDNNQRYDNNRRYDNNQRYDNNRRNDNNSQWNSERRDDHSSYQYMNPNSGSGYKNQYNNQYNNGRDQSFSNNRPNGNSNNSNKNQDFTRGSQPSNNSQSNYSRSNRGGNDSFQSRSGSDSRPDNGGGRSQGMSSHSEQANPSMGRSASSSTHSDRSSFESTRSNSGNQSSGRTQGNGRSQRER